jgi:uncharacterized protein YkwD
MFYQISLRALVVVLTISSWTVVARAQSEAIPSQEAAQQPQRITAEHRLINAVNRYRARYKLSPLSSDPTLMHIARQRVPFVSAGRSAGARGYNHHACGRWCRQHAREAGFGGPATDNLAMGYETPEGAVDGWASEDSDRDPAGHNYQMRGLAKINGRWVDEGYNRIGVAIRGRNYIAIFGRVPTIRK